MKIKNRRILAFFSAFAMMASIVTGVLPTDVAISVEAAGNYQSDFATVSSAIQNLDITQIQDIPFEQIIDGNTPATVYVGNTQLTMELTGGVDPNYTVGVTVDSIDGYSAGLRTTANVLKTVSADDPPVTSYQITDVSGFTYPTYNTITLNYTPEWIEYYTLDTLPTADPIWDVQSGTMPYDYMTWHTDPAFMSAPLTLAEVSNMVLIDNINLYANIQYTETSPIAPFAEELPTYKTITLVYNNGAENGSQITGDEGVVTDLGPNPTLAGYVFDGWYYDEYCTSAVDLSEPFTSDTTIYAGWQKAGVIVGFWIGGQAGELLSTWTTPIQTDPFNIVVADTETQVTMAINPLYASDDTTPLSTITGDKGAQPLSFYADGKNKNTTVTLEEGGDTTVTVTATAVDGGTSTNYTFNFVRQSSISGGATITLDYNDSPDGTTDTTVTYTYSNGVYGLPATTPVKPFYKFLYWEDLVGTQYSHQDLRTQAFSENTTLYAVYEQSVNNQVGLYDSTNGKVLWAIDITGTSMQWVPNDRDVPNHSGFMFAGWSLTPNGEVAYATSALLGAATFNGNTSVYAVYTAIANPEAQISWTSSWSDFVTGEGASILDQPFVSGRTDYTATLNINTTYLGFAMGFVNEGATFDISCDTDDVNFEEVHKDPNDSTTFDGFEMNGFAQTFLPGETATVTIEVTVGDASKTYTIVLSKPAATGMATIIGEIDNGYSEVKYHVGRGFEWWPWKGEDYEFTYWTTTSDGTGDRISYDAMKLIEFSAGQTYTYYAHFRPKTGLNWLDIWGETSNHVLDSENDFDPEITTYELTVPSNEAKLTIYANPDVQSSTAAISGNGTVTVKYDTNSQKYFEVTGLLFTDGEATLTITVTNSEQVVTATYTLTLTQGADRYYLDLDRAGTIASAVLEDDPTTSVGNSFIPVGTRVILTAAPSATPGKKFRGFSAWEAIDNGAQVPELVYSELNPPVDRQIRFTMPNRGHNITVASWYEDYYATENNDFISTVESGVIKVTPVQGYEISADGTTGWATTEQEYDLPAAFYIKNSYGEISKPVNLNEYYNPEIVELKLFIEDPNNPAVFHLDAGQSFAEKDADDDSETYYFEWDPWSETGIFTFWSTEPDGAGSHYTNAYLRNMEFEARSTPIFYANWIDKATNAELSWLDVFDHATAEGVDLVAANGGIVEDEYSISVPNTNIINLHAGTRADTANFTVTSEDATIEHKADDEQAYEALLDKSQYTGNWHYEISAFEKINAVNEVIITVTSPNGQVTKNYTLNITATGDSGNPSVTLNTDGGVIAAQDTLTEYVEGEGAVLPIPVKNGFVFDGWYTAADFGVSGVLVTEIGEDETGDKEYWAKYTSAENDARIIGLWIGDGSNGYAQLESAWQTNAEPAANIEEIKIPTVYNIAVSDTTEIAAFSLSLGYDKDGRVVVATSDGEAYDLTSVTQDPQNPDNPARKTFRVEGLDFTDDGIATIEITVKSTDNTTWQVYTVNFIKASTITPDVTVTLDYNDTQTGENDKILTYTIADGIIYNFPHDYPQKPGYIFTHWNTDETDEAGTEYTQADLRDHVFEENTTLYAIYNSDNNPSVSFYDGDTRVELRTTYAAYEYKLRTGLPYYPVKNGFSFAGWDTNPAGTGTRYTNETILTTSFDEDISLYAIYTEITDINAAITWTYAWGYPQPEANNILNEVVHAERTNYTVTIDYEADNFGMSFGYGEGTDAKATSIVCSDAAIDFTPNFADLTDDDPNNNGDSFNIGNLKRILAGVSFTVTIEVEASAGDGTVTRTYNIVFTKPAADGLATITGVLPNGTTEVKYHVGTGLEWWPWMNDETSFSYWTLNEDGTGTKYRGEQLADINFLPDTAYTYYAHFTTAYGLRWLDIHGNDNNAWLLVGETDFNADDFSYDLVVPGNETALRIFAEPNYIDRGYTLEFEGDATFITGIDDNQNSYYKAYDIQYTGGEASIVIKVKNDEGTPTGIEYTLNLTQGAALYRFDYNTDNIDYMTNADTEQLIPNGTPLPAGTRVIVNAKYAPSGKRFNGFGAIDKTTDTPIQNFVFDTFNGGAFDQRVFTMPAHGLHVYANFNDYYAAENHDFTSEWSGNTLTVTPVDGYKISTDGETYDTTAQSFTTFPATFNIENPFGEKSLPMTVNQNYNPLTAEVVLVIDEPGWIESYLLDAGQSLAEKDALDDPDIEGDDHRNYYKWEPWSETKLFDFWSTEPNGAGSKYTNDALRELEFEARTVNDFFANWVDKATNTDLKWLEVFDHATTDDAIISASDNNVNTSYSVSVPSNNIVNIHTATRADTSTFTVLSTDATVERKPDDADGYALLADKSEYDGPWHYEISAFTKTTSPNVITIRVTSPNGLITNDYIINITATGAAYSFGYALDPEHPENTSIASVTLADGTPVQNGYSVSAGTPLIITAAEADPGYTFYWFVAKNPVTDVDIEDFVFTEITDGAFNQRQIIMPAYNVFIFAHIDEYIAAQGIDFTATRASNTITITPEDGYKISDDGADWTPDPMQFTSTAVFYIQNPNGESSQQKTVLTTDITVVELLEKEDFNNDLTVQRGRATTIDADDMATGQGDLTITSVTGANASITVNYSAGASFTVTGVTVTTTPIELTVTIEDDNTSIEVEVTITAVTEPPAFDYGDANGDNVVDDRDVTRLLRSFAGWDVQISPGADANGDGTLDDRDVTRLLRKLAGWDVVLGPAIN